MSDKSGRWLSVEDFARAAGMTESEAQEAIQSGKVTAKVVSGREYVWNEKLDQVGGGSGYGGAEETRGEGRRGTSAAGDDRDAGQGSGGDAVVGETLVSRFSWPQELALQTERAISLVERSLNTFMMMHKEVVAEKDRFSEQSRQALQDRNQSFIEKDEKIKELEQALRDKDQEIADLRMLVEILEGQSQRARARKEEARESDRPATVGDMMEDQLRYIMEDQMIKELLKE